MVGIYGNLGEEIGFGYDHFFAYMYAILKKKTKHKKTLNFLKSENWKKMKQKLLGKRLLSSTRCFDLLQQNAFKVNSGYILAS